MPIQFVLKHRELRLDGTLLAMLGQPDYVTLARYMGGLIFAASQEGAAGARKVHRSDRALPRLKIGDLAITELGLIDGFYRFTAIGDGRIVAMPE